MPFKVVVKGRDDESGYDLSYGKGKNKLVAFATKQPNGRFLCTEIGVNDPVMLREIKESFAVWATANYQGEGEPVAPVSRPPAFRPPSKPAPTAQITEGERDAIGDGEAEFFLGLSNLRRKLTDAESRTLRDLTNYLTGIRVPVNIPKDDDHARDDDSAAPERPAAAELPAPSGPPPFRPAIGKVVAGPPRYNKPPAAQG